MDDPKPASDVLAGESVELPCRECGVAVITPQFLRRMATTHGVICSACSDRDNQRLTRQIMDRSACVRAERWKQLCPPDFLETKRERLPIPKKCDEVMSWEHGPQGLFLAGPTATGKSRCAWLLAKRQWMAGKSVRCLDYAGGIAYASRYSESPKLVEDWLERHCSVDLLLLDDVFKTRVTDSFESALFFVIARRTENQLPIIITANDSAATLLQRLSPDRGDAMLRRLKEFCKVISFVN
jgi:DNA replication protein DnaC